MYSAPVENIVNHHPARMSELMTVAEYFAGVGLFRMGLERAGWKVIYANDWDPERAMMYEGFFDDRYEVRDVFSVVSEDVPQTTLATCSFPCIDLSLAGNRRGLDGRHSSAFWGFHSVLKAQGLQAPPIVLLENVPGWLSANNGNDFYTVAAALNEIGYSCDVFMLNARSFVPQSRPRVFMVGAREPCMLDGHNNSPTFRFHRSKRLLPPKLRRLMEDNDHIRWANFDVPEPPHFSDEGFSETIVEEMPSDDPRWWPPAKVTKHLDMMPPAHFAMVQDLASRARETSRTFYRRRRPSGQRAEVRSDDIAGCLRTAVGGSGKQFLVVAGKGTIRMRTLTPREYARLQGVPDTFPIVANTERQSLSAFGDAVCVPVVTWIAKMVLPPLLEKLSVSLAQTTSHN